MQQGVKFSADLTQMSWLLLSLYFDITHKQIHKAHTGTNRPTHKYILTPRACYVLTATVCITLNEALPDIKNKVYKSAQYLCFSIIIHLSKSYVCRLDSIRPSLLCEKQRILIEIVKKMSKRHTHRLVHTHTTHRKKDDIRND